MTDAIRWTWAFLDVPVPRTAASLAFWTAATHTSTSPWRGADDEFTTLVPSEGPAWLKLQRVGDDVGGVHVDFDVDDPARAAARAEALGATVVAHRGFVAMQSPGGFGFCFTTWDGGDARAVVRDGAASLADQVCIDIPADNYTTEATFWAELTGWPRRTSSVRDEFDWLDRPAELPVRLLLQRMEEPAGPVRGHLDIACADRATTLQRHLDLGATTVGQYPHWTLLHDPVGRAYCLTDRDPATGLLGAG